MGKWYSRTRPFTAFGGAVVLILLTLGAVGYTRFQAIRAATRNITEDALPCVYLIGKLQTGTLLKFTLLTDHLNSQDKAEKARLVERIAVVDAEMLDVMARYERLIDDPQDRALFDALKAARQPYLDCYLRVLNLSREDKREEALQLIETQLKPLRNRLFAAADAEVVWNQADADHAGEAIGTAVDWTSIGFLTCLIFAIGVHTVAHYAGKRLRAERTLRDEQRLFREVFQEAPFGMSVAGLDGRYLQVNSSLCRILGYSEQELLRLYWTDVTHPDDLEDSLSRKAQLLADPGICREWEKRYVRRDGNIVRARIRISAVLRSATGKDRDGDPPYFVVHVEDITERTRTEEALRESEGRFENIADSCPSMMWVTDAEGNNQSINRAYREFCGTTLADVEGGKWKLIIHPDDAPEYIAAFERAIREKASFRAEARVRRADGEWRWFGSYAQPRLSRGGVFLGHVGLSADITGRLQAEEKLLAARQAAEDDARHHEFQHSLIRAILEVSLDGILVVNDDNRIVSHNQRFLDVWQISMPVQPPNSSVPAIDDALLLSGACRRVKNPEAFAQRIQDLYRDPDATDQCEIELNDGRTLERYSTGLRGEKGQYLGRAWFFRDTTVRKQAENALQNSEAKFRQLAENIREVFWMVVPVDYQVLYVSPAYEQVWGRTSESVYLDPMSWAKAIHPDDQERSHSIFARQLQGESIESEYRIRTPDGTEKWIRDRAFPIRDGAGDLVRVVGIAEDITEQKRFYEELVQTREAADAANRAKSNFLAQMSHEIRTPMNGIIGMLQLLAESALSPLQQRYAEVAQECGHSLLSIIDDILDLSKIEARKVAIEHIDFDLRNIVESSAEGLQVRARNKGLAFEIRVDADIPVVLRGDPQRLRQVLGNLVSNAVKFTPQGKVSLDVGLERRSEGQATLRFAVADTGIGIRPD